MVERFLKHHQERFAAFLVPMLFALRFRKVATPVVERRGPVRVADRASNEAPITIKERRDAIGVRRGAAREVAAAVVESVASKCGRNQREQSAVLPLDCALGDYGAVWPLDANRPSYGTVVEHVAHHSRVFVGVRWVHAPRKPDIERMAKEGNTGVRDQGFVAEIVANNLNVVPADAPALVVRVFG